MVADDRVVFRPVKAGITTLDGRSQVLDGLAVGDEVVVHSERALQPDAKVKVVPTIVRANP
jgi:HlyD family secretion protein